MHQTNRKGEWTTEEHRYAQKQLRTWFLEILLFIFLILENFSCEDENDMSFLRGLNECRWGSWALMAAKYVTTRSPSQICSHAQKYQNRYYARIQQAQSGSSIHDNELVDGHGTVLPLPQSCSGRATSTASSGKSSPVLHLNYLVEGCSIYYIGSYFML